MKYLRHIFFIICIFIAYSSARACECDPIVPVSEEVLENYNVIFYGVVDSVSSGEKSGTSVAYFKVDELYKGKLGRNVLLKFDGETDCMMSFSEGEKWLIYANFFRFDDLTVNICGHSRKFFEDSANDYYQLAAQRTFQEEKEYLEEKLKLQPIDNLNEINTLQQNFKPHNTQPSGINKLWLLLCSFLVMVIVYFITRKKD